MIVDLFSIFFKSPVYFCNQLLISKISHRQGCFGAPTKCYKYLRKLLKFEQMDFEFALWQLTYLFIAPHKVFGSFQSRKRMCNVLKNLSSINEKMSFVINFPNISYDTSVFQVVKYLAEILLVLFSIFRNKVTVCQRRPGFSGLTDMLALRDINSFCFSLEIELLPVSQIISVRHFCRLHRRRDSRCNRTLVND